MSIQTPIVLEPKMLNFADIFTDGCDVKFVQGASCNVRAALPDGSLVDLTFTPARDTTREEVNQLLKTAAEGAMKGVLDWSDEPLVSIDLMHSAASSTVDSLETAVIEGKLVRVVSWYDNEWGFSNRMVDTAHAMARLI